MAADGLILNVNTAPANLQYTGIFNGFTVDHPRWGVSGTFDSGIVDPTETFQASYTVGMDAGTLLISAPKVSLQGAIDASVTAGPTQTTLPQTGVANSPFITTGTQDPFQQAQNVVPIGGELLVGSYSEIGLTAPGPQTVIFGNGFPSGSGASDFSMRDSSASDSNPASGSGMSSVSLISATQISNSGLASVSVTASQSIDIQAPLTVGSGGQVTLTAPFVAVKQSITASAGSVTATNIFTPLTVVANAIVPGPQTPLTFTSPNAPAAPAVAPPTAAVTLAADTTIDTRGQFTNALISPSDSPGEAFVNGGNVTLVTTGPLTLGAGSLIDASSGAAVLTSGSTLGGKGGNIILDASFEASGTAPLTLGGTLRSIGVTQGGALTCRRLRSSSARRSFRPRRTSSCCSRPSSSKASRPTTSPATATLADAAGNPLPASR